MDSSQTPPGGQALSGRKKLDLLLRLAQASGGAPDRIRPRADDGPAPLSFGQERLWLVHQLDPGTAAYNVTGAFRLPRVDAAILERALGDIVHRHEALRTTFFEIGGAAMQVVAPFTGFALPVEDLSALDAEAREAAVRRRAAADAALPYDLARGPLFRPRLLRLGDEDVLLLNLHHVVCDRWSMAVLSRELTALYAAHAAGRDAALATLEIQYADYAAWQRAHLAGETLDREMDYWRERLAGAPALLELPLDHPRPAVQSFRGARQGFALGAEPLERLRSLAHGEDATVFQALLAAFQVLLARYGGTDDIVVGTPVAGRGKREVEGLIGFFVNTLAVRTDLSGDPSFREVLRRVRAGVMGALDHQDLPFEKLVAEMQPDRALSHSPIFQVMFLAESAPPSAGGTAGLPLRELEVETGTAQFDLTLELNESARGLLGAMTYATDLFEAATIERMLRHYARVLEQVADDPDARLSSLELLDADERRLLVEDWNRTDRPFPREATLHGLFDAQVRARPDAIALVWDAAQLTYAELDARTNQLAHRLMALGVGPDARVGVLLERGLELVVCILAIVKAGGCYVPLDPTYPAERLRLMVDDAALRAVLTRSDLAGSIEDARIPIVHLDKADLSSESTEAPQSGATPENLAYIVYTSGSTGRPKGVMVEHRHVVQLVVETDYVRFGPGDRVAQASNASFDALAFEAWGAFLNGATLVGIPRDVLLSPSAFRQMLRDQQIATLYQTTALLNQLTREEPDIFAPLREVLFGGQAADADSIRRLLRTGKPQRLLHMYGPTETTAWSSYETVEHVSDNALTVSVGRPTGNQRVYILDAGLRPMPLGVPGEAYVGGAGVVRGYLDRPGLTAERFVPDPFAAEPGARMYRTGDRLRWKVDGTLEFAGRLDAQVKIRGFRIEPGEIESALSAHPSVREARVVVREDVPGEARLVAYVVGEVDADAMRAHLRRSLPEYMVPAAFVGIDRLPLTPNGKLDVRALPAPEFVSEDGFVEPRTPAEEVVVGIWAAVLRLERVGIHDNFFELGGHSLLATRVVSRVREVFGIELPLRALFEGPTVAEVAERVEAIRREGLPILPPIVPVERDGPLPLSFAQERLWFIDRLDPGSAAYGIPSALRLTGALDVPTLERALGEIVRRHEALRTTFADRDGAPVQLVAPFADFRLPVEDLSALDETVREDAVLARASEDANRPFDLAAGPLFRASVLRLADDDHVLLMSMHHVVSDGWSMGILFREMVALYAAYLDGAEPPLPPLPVQYADYAVWQRGQLRGEALDRQMDWWRERLEGAPALLELPTDRPRPPRQTYRGAREPVALPAELLDRLRALGRGEGATLYMVLLAAFHVLLAKYAGSEDVVTGSPVAGRSRGETEGLIGFFVNTLVLRTDLSGDPPFREVLRRVRGVTLDAYERQDVPFEKLVAELQPERSLSHAPLFQVVFTLGDAEPPQAGPPGLRVRGVGAELPTTKFDLTLGLTAHASGIGGVMEYSTDLFDRTTIQRMLGHLRRVLEDAAADPDTALSALDLLDDDERRLVVDAWNQPMADPPTPYCIHHRFEAQAARTPDAAALTFGGVSLTYAELNAWANRLAHHLRRRGVGPEVRVGLCLERGMEMVVAIIAVLKAGGAYVPLDPAHPPGRIAWTLADAGIPIVVTQAAVRGALGEPEGVDVVCLEDARAEIEAESAENPESGATPASLAYVIYTSGSTGTPKGALIEHRNVARLFDSTDAWFGFGPDDVWTLFHSYAFDFSVWEMWGALLHGGRLVVVPFGVSRDPQAFHALVQAEGVTVLNQTPSAFRQFIRADGERGGELALRTVVFGGEALEPASLREWVDQHGVDRPRLVNMYGITETTVHVTYRPLTEADVYDGGASPIGIRIPDLRLYVLDPARRPLPVGIPGELYVGGAGVARGYLNRPELTAERFIDSPFVDGDRLYRTGDRVRWLADGTLEYLGRLDAQVKVRGFRIELGEIEAALRGFPGVTDCAVVARADAAGEARLVAYVVGEGEADALRTHLRALLPEYMVPSAFVAMETLPLTPNGKLDTRALPAPTAAAPGRRLRPETELEARLAALWAELLEVEEVGVEDNFFDLGGHSLLLVRLQARLASELGRQVPVVELFQYPTVRSLAAWLQTGGAEERSDVAEGEERGGARQAALARRRAARGRREE